MIALAVVLAGAGLAVVITKPFSSGGAGTPEVAQNTAATGIYTVARQDLSSQTQVPATLGYAGSYSVSAPSGASAQQVAQAQQTVAEDQLSLSADRQTESAKAIADNQSVSAAQSTLTAARSTLSADQPAEAQDCAGSGASGAACTSATQKVSQDQTALTQAQQQATSAQSTATQDQDQDQVQVAVRPDQAPG